MIRALLLALTLALALPLAAAAQDRATLIADRVEIRGDDTLVAEGGVEVFYRGARLRASSIVYDSTTDSLRIEGPIVLEDGEDSLILADQAALAADLTEGVLTSARLVLNQQLQLAAREIVRAGGRYTQLSRTVASSCKVCAGDPTPLWEIRARRVVHDEQERQIYFDNAQFRLAGVPVFYIPRLRMPDPSLKRSSGFLMPKVRSTSGLGFGLKTPYFLALGQSRDLTVTPYLTTKDGRSVELRYREAFRTGGIELTGALSRDRLLPDEDRGYLFATGAFTLPRDFALTFQAEMVSDPAYLLDYGVSDADRLESSVEISRTRRNEYISGRVINFYSIRAGDVNANLPSLVGDLTFHRRFSGGPFGGEAGLRFQTHGHRRSSTSALDGDGDGIADGRDVRRASLRLDWRRSWLTGQGIEIAALGELAADAYTIGQDAVFAGTKTRTRAAAAVEFRWPWVKAGAGGVSHVIEPVLQLVASPTSDENLPNEDSALVEFDEGNLFSLNRFPGADAVERGSRANIGISYTRHDPAGWSMGLTLGRVIRADDLDQFGAASGLDGIRSDWLAAGTLSMGEGLRVTNRLVLDDSLDLTKAEVRMDVARERLGLATSYIWVQPDLSENRPDRTEEIAFDTSYRFTPNWTGKFTGRYDFESNRGTVAGLGLEFRNECILVDLSLSRRFTSSTSVKPTTDFSLSVDLLGFGNSAAAGPQRVCRH